jgi:hypothetical protein
MPAVARLEQQRQPRTGLAVGHHQKHPPRAQHSAGATHKRCGNIPGKD